jgi:predicted Zn-dependent peptidase
MITLDRKSAPQALPITRFSIREGEKTALAGVPIYYVNDAQNDVLKLDFYYNCGVKHQPANGVANATIQLLPEGTKLHTSEEIAIMLDSQGAYLQTQSNRDEGVITLYCVPRFLSVCVDIIIELIESANYPENEVDIYRENTLQQLLVSEQKTSYLARKAFNAAVFGSQNYYGSAVNQQDILNISRETLYAFYQNVLSKKPKYVLAAGHVTPNVLKETERLLVGLSAAESPKTNATIIHTFLPETIWVEKPDAVQCSIRMGKPLFNRKHPDYRELSIVNMILGGYFGSRLMKNIREEKGLTYGIYASVDPYFDAGAFYIGAEVNAILVDQVLEETRKEILRMINEPIGKDELDTVKSYYLGSFIRGFDGVFSLASYYKSLIDFDLTYEYYYGYLDVINNINSQRIMELAHWYLHPDTMCTVIAGKKI